MPHVAWPPRQSPRPEGWDRIRWAREHAWRWSLGERWVDESFRLVAAYPRRGSTARGPPFSAAVLTIIHRMGYGPKTEQDLLVRWLMTMDGAQAFLPGKKLENREQNIEKQEHSFF